MVVATGKWQDDPQSFSFSMTRVGEFQLDKVAPMFLLLHPGPTEESKIIKSILYCPDYMISISNAHLSGWLGIRLGFRESSRDRPLEHSSSLRLICIDRAIR